MKYSSLLRVAQTWSRHAARHSRGTLHEEYDKSFSAPRPGDRSCRRLGEACSDSGASSTVLEAVTDTVDGVTRLTYPETGAQALGWRLDTVAVIGGYGAEADEYQFDQVGPGSLAGDPLGNLCRDRPDGEAGPRLRRRGSFIGSWGREGSGPGELQMPTGLGVGSADTLWVTGRQQSAHHAPSA